VKRKEIEECTDLIMLEKAEERAYQKCVDFNNCSICPLSYNTMFHNCELNTLTKRIRLLVTNLKEV